MESAPTEPALGALVRRSLGWLSSAGVWLAAVCWAGGTVGIATDGADGDGCIGWAVCAGWAGCAWAVCAGAMSAGFDAMKLRRIRANSM